MLSNHRQIAPTIHPDAWVAPNAMLSGAVSIGKGSRVMHGAQVIAENSPISIGENCIVLENAVIRGTEGFPVRIGDHCLIGPHAHLAGCTLHHEVFVATGAAIFHGAVLEQGTEVRIHGVVHVGSVLTKDKVVPIHWVAVGNPAQLFPPDQHEAIWEQQQKMHFNRTVYGIEETQGMRAICKVMSTRLGKHAENRSIADD